MTKLYILLARYKNGSLGLLDTSEEFIFTERQDALVGLQNLQNIPSAVAEMELHEFFSNQTIEVRKIA